MNRKEIQNSELTQDLENDIYQAARQGRTDVLEAQLQKNRAAYLAVLERVESEYIQAQIENDRQSFRVVDNAIRAEEAKDNIFAVIKKCDMALYKEILEKWRRNGGRQEMERLIAAVVPSFEDAALVKAYLYGLEKVESLYPCLEHLREQWSYASWMGILKEYSEKYSDDGFVRRCQVLMLLWHSDYSAYFFDDWISVKEGEEWKISPQLVKTLFQNFEKEGVGISWQLDGVIYVYAWYARTDKGEGFLAGAQESFAGYLRKKREETLQAFAQAEVFGRFFGLRVLRQAAKENKAEILKYAQDTAKSVKQELFDILCHERDWEKEVCGLLASKKAAQRELAVRVLSAWQEAGADYGELLAQAAEKEKNAKIRELLGNVLVTVPEKENGAGVHLREELVRKLHKGNQKRSLAWAYETPFSKVHFVKGDAPEENMGETTGQVMQAKNGVAEGLLASEEYLQAIFLAYASGIKAWEADLETVQAGMKESNKKQEAAQENHGKNGTAQTGMQINNKKTGASQANNYKISENAAFLASALDAAEFAVYVNELFDKWLFSGAESKKRRVLYVAAIHGGSTAVEKMERQIREWPRRARGAIACEAVRALGLSPLPQALFALDGIARNFRYRQVRSAADEVLNRVAGQLGIGREELADQIVPDFGFDEHMERYFDYGGRVFLAALTPELEIEVFETAKASATAAKRQKEADIRADHEGSSSQKPYIRTKELKTLPVPGKNDDAAKASAAYEEFKRLKKQLKATANSQKQRMEDALWSAREWGVDAWNQLFVKNPVMRPFATELIWGIYEDGKLVKSFRYMEDGTFNTVDEEEYALPDDGRIALVHPLDLTEKTNAAWQEQLADYEIVPPIAQLARTAYKVTKAEAEEKELARFCDWVVNDILFGDRLTKFGRHHGPVGDAGYFEAWCREDKKLGIGVELDFSGSYVQEGQDEDVTVYCVRFYKMGNKGYGENADIYALGEVPKRYFSEVVQQLVMALGMKG